MPGEALVLDAEARFSCTTCGGCCENPWLVLCDDTKKQALVALGYADIFEPGPQAGTWAIQKRLDGACSQLGDDGLCVIHAAHGEAAKPLMCQRFPYVHVASDEHVWVSASHGCKAVREGLGAALSAEQAERLFEKDLSEADPNSGTVYPIDDGLDWSTAELDAALDALEWGDDVFELMQRLGCWEPRAATRHGVLAAFGAGPSSTSAEGEARYAFALTLYADLMDQGSVWSRLKGVFLLPRALEFRLRYRSRLIDTDIDMARVRKHAGALPPESHALLIRWLRGHVRGRRIFQDVPFATAGITRLLLQADAVLFFARALAVDRSIEHEDVLHALRQVELFIAHQRVTTALSKLDPRLPGFWRSAAVRRAAAALMAPSA